MLNLMHSSALKEKSAKEDFLGNKPAEGLKTGREKPGCEL